MFDQNQGFYQRHEQQPSQSQHPTSTSTPYANQSSKRQGYDEEAYTEQSHPSRYSSPEDKYNMMNEDNARTQNKNKNTTKAKYIAKEQRNRRDMLEKEYKQMSYLGTSQYGLQKSFSLSIQPTNTDSVDSNFKETDWTPVDSSYGGAFPFCGWVPKRIRQATEQLLLVIASFTMIYFLVTVAMKLTAGSGRSSGSSSSFEFDDDHYIQAGNDDADYTAYNTYYNDDDDLFDDAY